MRAPSGRSSGENGIKRTPWSGRKQMIHGREGGNKRFFCFMEILGEFDRSDLQSSWSDLRINLAEMFTVHYK